jgi:hypothetical protein
MGAAVTATSPQTGAILSRRARLKRKTSTAVSSAAFHAFQLSSAGRCSPLPGKMPREQTRLAGISQDAKSLTRPRPVKVEADDVAAGDRSRERAGFAFRKDFRPVTPYRSPWYTPSP